MIDADEARAVAIGRELNERDRPGIRYRAGEERLREDFTSYPIRILPDGYIEFNPPGPDHEKHRRVLSFFLLGYSEPLIYRN